MAGNYGITRMNNITYINNICRLLNESAKNKYNTIDS